MAKVPPVPPALLRAARPYLRQVATRCFCANGGGAGASFTHGMSQSSHILRERVSDRLVGEWGNYRMVSASESLPATAGTLKVSLRMPDGSWLLADQCRDNGDGPVVHPPGHVQLSWTLNSPLPRHYRLLCRAYQSNSSGIVWQGVAGGNPYGADPDDYMDIGTAPNDKTTSGAAIGPSNGIGYYPIVLAAQTTQPAVLICGTSRECGGPGVNNDRPNDLGPTARIVGRSMGYTNFALAGTLLSTWNSGSHAKLYELVGQGYWSHLVNEYGINDVPGGTTPATIAGRRAAFAAALKAARPDIVIIGQTLYPYAPSSDVFTTKAGQSDGSNNVRVLEFNALARLGIAGEDACWDSAAAIDPAATGRYPVSSDWSVASRTPTIVTGSISGGTLSVSAVVSGPPLSPSDPIMDPTSGTGAVVADSTIILRQLTGTPGGVGTYQLSKVHDGAYPRNAAVSSRTLSTAGWITRDGLHLQYYGEELVVRNGGPALLALLGR